MADEFDPWALDSGLIDDVDIVIKSAKYDYDDEVYHEGRSKLYNNGQTLGLMLECIVDDDDNPEEWVQVWCGNDVWDKADKQGTAAKRTDGKNKGFSQQSHMGEWIKAAFACGAEEVLRERGGEMGQLSAKVWEGLHFHIKRKNESFTIDGEERKTMRLLPTEFKGVKGGGSSSGKSASSSKSAKASTKEESEEGTSNGVVPAALRAKLKKAAGNSESLEAFMEAAYEIDGVDGNKVVEDALEGIYAEVSG